MPDAQPDYIAGDLTINDQESIVELILEKVMGIDNAIEEHDEPDEDESQSTQLSKDFKLYPTHYCTNFNSVRTYTKVFNKAAYGCNDLPQYFHEITPPPPKG